MRGAPLPKRTRKQESRFAVTPLWTRMQKDIDTGLKPNEFLQLVLTPEEKEAIGIKNRRTIARFVKSYIKSKHLRYLVSSFNRDGSDYIVVKDLPVISQVA